MPSINPAKPYEKHPGPFMDWPDQDRFFARNAIEVLGGAINAYGGSTADLVILAPSDSHDSQALSTLVRKLGFVIKDRAKFPITEYDTPEHLRHYGSYNHPPDKPAYVEYWHLNTEIAA